MRRIFFKIRVFTGALKDTTKIRTRIVDNLAVLEEELRHVESAWQLVHKDAFPNNQKHKSYKNQQMKDSVILCHLLDFHINIEKPLFFWTFDAFGYMPNEKPPSPFSNEMSPGYNIPIAYDINDILYDAEHEIKADRKSKSVLGI